METIGQRLKRLREAKGLSQGALAKNAGLKSQGAIGNIESGTRGYGESIVDIARVLSTTPDYLRCMTDDPRTVLLMPANTSSAGGGLSMANTSPGPSIKGVYPLISKVQAGMWSGLCEQFQPHHAQEWLPSTKNLGRCGYMLRVDGKSMENPSGRHNFAEGMVLHVNPDLTPDPGQYVVVRRNGTQEATFKRYVLIDGEKYLEAINPDWPKDMKYLPLQPGDEWCGVVVDASLGGLI